MKKEIACLLAFSVIFGIAACSKDTEETTGAPEIVTGYEAIEESETTATELESLPTSPYLDLMDSEQLTYNGELYSIPAPYQALQDLLPLSDADAASFLTSELNVNEEYMITVLSDHDPEEYPMVMFTVGNYTAGTLDEGPVAFMDAPVRHLVIEQGGVEATDFDFQAPGGGALGMSSDEIVMLYGEVDGENYVEFENGGYQYTYCTYSTDGIHAVYKTFSFYNDVVVGIDLEWC